MTNVHIVMRGSSIVRVYGSRKRAEQGAIDLARQLGIHTQGWFALETRLNDTDGVFTGIEVLTEPVDRQACKSGS